MDELGADVNNPVDGDGDGIPDYLDDDSDNDGQADSVDANRSTVEAADDAGSASYGGDVRINILSNDDIEPGPSVTISRTGGTAAGNATFDPADGTVSYTAGSGESGDVSITYEVCFTGATPAGCASGSVTISVAAPGHCRHDITTLGTDPERQAIARLYLLLFRRTPDSAGLGMMSWIARSLEIFMAWVPRCELMAKAVLTTGTDCIINQ